MKRHSARKEAAAVANNAISTEPPWPSEPSGSAAVLYVDVVKNMPKSELPPASSIAPEFSIFREDFPALPGTRANSRASSAVPDDWTEMISDDTDDEPSQAAASDTSVEPISASEEPASASEEPVSASEELESVEESPPVSTPSSRSESVSAEDEAGGCYSQPGSSSGSEYQPECDYETDTDPMADLNNNNNLHTNGNGNGNGNNSSYSSVGDVSYYLPPPLCSFLARHGRCGGSYIFDHQFLIAGQRARAFHLTRTAAPAPPQVTLPPPPGFEGAKFYARLRTNKQGMPLGGVTFDLVSPKYDLQWALLNQANRRSNVNGSGVLGNAYGMLGLARKLGAAQRNPLLMQNVFGHDATRLSVDMHCGGNRLYSTFAGPLQGGRLYPHDVQYDVPHEYLVSERLGLQQPKIDQMEAELLFFFFYTYPGDMMQLLAATELAERGWRFHKQERLWLMRQVDNPSYVQRGRVEVGEYNYFNMLQWKIMSRHFELMPEQLERTLTKAELLAKYGFHPQMSY